MFSSGSRRSRSSPRAQSGTDGTHVHPNRRILLGLRYNITSNRGRCRVGSPSGSYPCSRLLFGASDLRPRWRIVRWAILVSARRRRRENHYVPPAQLAAEPPDAGFIPPTRGIKPAANDRQPHRLNSRSPVPTAPSSAIADQHVPHSRSSLALLRGDRLRSTSWHAHRRVAPQA